MGPDRNDPPLTVSRPHETLCWRDILHIAISGLYPTDSQLEKMLDHLERTP